MATIDLTTKVSTLHFPFHDNKLQDGFECFGVRTVRDLCLRTRSQLRSFKDVGNKSLNGVEDILFQYGLDLAMTEQELDEYQAKHLGGGTSQKDCAASESITVTVDESVWEQRRYELAKELLLNSSTMLAREQMEGLVDYADMFIRCLKGESEPLKG